MFNFRKKQEPAKPVSNIHTVVEQRQTRSVFQPLVDLATQEVFAYEALARCDVDEFRSPPKLFEAAVDNGLVGALGRLMRTLAIEGCPNVPLFINIHPNEFDERFLVLPDDPLFNHEELVFLEITESVPIHYFEQCHSVLAEIRSKGVKLAVDDLGSGFSNLKYISDLEPEVVKLDRELIAGVKDGTRQFTLLKSLIRLCQDMGSKVVAEGIETAEELEAVLEAGAHYGQGYLLARPGAPPPEPAWPL